MKRLAAGLALVTSVAAFLVIVGGGLFLAVIENSGERMVGALLALSGAIAFAAVLMLVFARQGGFAGRGGRAGALTAALLGVLPVAALGAGALRVSGLPFGSAVPLLDWTIFFVGVVLALGAAAVLATGYWRMKEAPPARARPEAVRPASHAAPPPEHPVRPQQASTSTRQPQRPAQPVRLAEPPATPAAQADHDDDDVRVTPVELPSIGRFRQR